mgnify:CR=1 FL=1
MKTRHKFVVDGVITWNGIEKFLSFKVNSDTSIIRIINILCQVANKDASDITSVLVSSTYESYGEWQHVNLNKDELLTFRSLALVGRKAIKVVVDCDSK